MSDQETNHLGFSSGSKKTSPDGRNHLGFDSKTGDEGPRHGSGNPTPPRPKNTKSTSTQSTGVGEDSTAEPDKSSKTHSQTSDQAQSAQPEKKKKGGIRKFMKDHPILTAGVVGLGCIALGGPMIGLAAGALAAGGGALVAGGALLVAGAAIAGTCYGAYKLGKAVGKAFGKWNEKRKARNEVNKARKKALAIVGKPKSKSKSSEVQPLLKDSLEPTMSNPVITKQADKAIAGLQSKSALNQTPKTPPPIKRGQPKSSSLNI